MLVPAFILAVVGYALYKYYSSDKDEQQLPPSAPLSPAQPSHVYSSDYSDYSSYSGSYDSGTAGTDGSTRFNASGATEIYGYSEPSGSSGTHGNSGSSGYSGATTSSASYRTPSYYGTSSNTPTRNPQPARPTIQRTKESNNKRVSVKNRIKRSSKPNSESDEQLQFRRTVLSHYKCPFEEEEACRFKQNPRQCLFTHVGPDDTGATDDGTLKDVPAYACIYNLTNSCRSVNNTTNNEQNPNSCNDGIHLSVEQMVDLEYYERANRQTIRRFFGRDADRQCGVCLETVLSKRLSRTRRFAILENCTHCFCVQCINGWRSRNDVLTCPLCRTVSDRIVYRRRFTDKPEYKRNMFP